MEVQLPPLTAGPNLHLHTNEDELFYVLGGVMTIQVGEDFTRSPAGGWPGVRGVRLTPTPTAPGAVAGVDPVDTWRGGRTFRGDGHYFHTVAGAPDEEVTAAITARYGGARVGPPISIP